MDAVHNIRPAKHKISVSTLRRFSEMHKKAFLTKGDDAIISITNNGI